MLRRKFFQIVGAALAGASAVKAKVMKRQVSVGGWREMNDLEPHMREYWLGIDYGKQEEAVVAYCAKDVHGANYIVQEMEAFKSEAKLESYLRAQGFVPGEGALRDCWVPKGTGMRNLRAVIATNEKTLNGHRYSMDALTSMVQKINEGKILLYPDASGRPQSLESVAGKLTKAVLKADGDRVEVVVDGNTLDTPQGKALEAFFPDPPKPDTPEVVVLAVGTGEIKEGEVVNYSLEYVGLCPKSDSAVPSARIL